MGRPTTLNGQTPTPPHRHVTTVQECMAYTYYNLRYGLAVLAFLFPIVLRLGLPGRVHPGSISAYYHTSMRNYFVATLVALGVFLVLYRGFSRPESWILNVAGVSVIGVAFLPTGRDGASTDPEDTFIAPHLHGLCALIAFGCMAIVIECFGTRTLELIPKTLRSRFRGAYHILAGLMIILPIACWILAYKKPEYLFIVETVALYVFVAYWFTKTLEFHRSGAETLAISGDLIHTPAATGRIKVAKVVPATRTAAGAGSRNRTNPATVDEARTG